MAEAIGPGSTVVCVKWTEPDWPYRAGYDKATPGSYYKVKAVHTGVPDEESCPWDACGFTGLKLEDMCGKYCPNLFKPIGEGFMDVQSTVEEPTVKDAQVRACEPV